MYKGMARPSSSPICDSDIVGLEYFDRLMPLLQRLHDVGARRDRAGNRTLFFDQYCAYILLFLFNPIVCGSRKPHRLTGSQGNGSVGGASGTSVGSLITGRK
jgi:hypothetical protein